MPSQPRPAPKKLNPPSEPKPHEPAEEANVGNPSRAAQEAAGDKATAPAPPPPRFPAPKST